MVGFRTMPSGSTQGFTRSQVEHMRDNALQQGKETDLYTFTLMNFAKYAGNDGRLNRYEAKTASDALRAQFNADKSDPKSILRRSVDKDGNNWASKVEVMAALTDPNTLNYERHYLEKVLNKMNESSIENIYAGY